MTNFLKIIISILSSFLVCFFIYFLFFADIIIINESKILILFLIVFVTFFLFILSILLLIGRTRYETVRDKLSLLAASIMEEIINSKSIADLEKIKKNLKNKKDNMYKLLKINSKKISKKSLNSIEDQLNIIFNKIENILVQNLEGKSSSSILDKVEMLLEKLMNVVTEKGIQINSSINTAAINQYNDSQNYNVLKNINDLNKVEELLEMEDIIEPKENLVDENTNNPEELQEINDETGQDILNTMEEIEEIPEFKIPNQQQDIKNNDDLNELFEVEDVNVMSDNIQYSDEVDIVGDIQDINADKEEINFEFDINNTKFENSEIIQEDKDNKNEVPIIPKEFYEINKKDDELANQINELNDDKSGIQHLLKEIYQAFHVDNLMVLINEKNENNFKQINQIGNNQNNYKRVDYYDCR